jgi:hypothetical protein
LGNTNEVTKSMRMTYIRTLTTPKVTEEKQELLFIASENQNDAVTLKTYKLNIVLSYDLVIRMLDI